MEIGGAERALLGLLESFDKDQFDVDLFLMRHSGDLLDLLPTNINLLPELSSYSSLAIPIKQVIKKKQYGIFWGRLYSKIKARQFIRKNHITTDNFVELTYSHKFTNRYMPIISNKEYDLAISFLTPHYFAADKVKAKKRIAWIHTDYSYVDLDIHSELEMWSKYDYIASISHACTEGFISKFPVLADRIIEIENIISPNFIVSQSLATDVCSEMPDDGTIKILSVGRYSPPKNFDNVPEICRLIREAGLNIKWYIIGYGSEEALIKQKIQEYGMSDYVILLGKKSNPYPYMARCDVYIQPSRYEGKCVAVREAQILGKPVIITDYTTAHSQLTDEVDGYIVPLDNTKCAIAVENLIRNNQKLDEIKRNLKNIDYSNYIEINKICKLL